MAEGYRMSHDKALKMGMKIALKEGWQVSETRLRQLLRLRSKKDPNTLLFFSSCQPAGGGVKTRGGMRALSIYNGGNFKAELENAIANQWVVSTGGGKTPDWHQGPAASAAAELDEMKKKMGGE